MKRSHIKYGLLAVLTLSITAGFLYYLFIYQPRSRASGAAAKMTVLVNADNIIGTVDKDPLGNYNDSDVWNLLHRPYPTNEWSYLWTVDGQTALRELGVTNWIFTDSLRSDWEHPTIPWTDSPPSLFVQKSDPTKSCPSSSQPDCMYIYLDRWAFPYPLTTTLNDWFTMAKSYGGKLAIKANTDYIKHMKADYYTVGNNGGNVQVKSFSRPDFSGPTINGQMDFNEIESILSPYVDKRPATPEDTVNFLKWAKSQGFTISYVELSPEPWNSPYHPFTPASANVSEKYALILDWFIPKAKKWYAAIKQYDPSIEVGSSALQLKDAREDLSDRELDNPELNPWNLPFFKAIGKHTDFIIQHRYIGFNGVNNSADPKLSSPVTVRQESNFSYSLPQKDHKDNKYMFQWSGGDDAKIYRKQLLRYLPDKVNIPIHLAFNVWGPNLNDGAPNPGSRLFTGFSNAAFYLDQLWPQRIEGKYYPGVQTAYIGSLEGLSSWYAYPQNVNDPASQPVFYPVWHIFHALKKIADKDIIKVNPINQVKNSVLPDRNALEVKAVVSHNKDTLALIIMNHDPSADIPIRVLLSNFKPKKKADVSYVGDGSNISFSSYNSYSRPDLIHEKNQQLDLDITGKTVKGLVVPAHTFMIVELKAE